MVAVAVVAMPAAVGAQKAQVFDPLLPFYRALAGTYGDEGRQLTAAAESLPAALTAWDTGIRASDAELRARLPGANVQTAIQIHTQLASIYSERGRFADALREFEEDIRLDPQRAAFHRLKALVLLELNRRADAAAALRAAWLADPSDPLNGYALIVSKATATTAAERNRARATLAALERSLVRGERAKAGAPFLTLRAIDDDVGGAMAFAPSAYARSISLLLGGRLDTGIAALRDAVAADPLVADPALRDNAMTRGIAALRQGFVTQALDAMRSAVTRAPASSEARRMLATAEIAEGDVTGGIQDLREAVRLNPKNERAWLALARVLDETGDTTGAADALHTAVTELPEAGALRWQLTELSRKRQRTDATDVELLAGVDRLILLAGTSELYERIAKLAQAQLEYGRAITLLDAAVRLTPNSARAHASLGRAYLDQGRDDEAYAELVVSLWLDPADAATLSVLGRLHLAAGRLEPALDTLSRAVDRDPVDAAAVHALGEALVRAGRTAEADRVRATAERLSDQQVETERRQRTLGMLSLQADVHTSQRDYPAAIEVLMQGVALEGRSASMHVKLATALVAAGRYAEATMELQTAIALNGGIDLHRRLADVYATLGRGDDASRERRLYTELRLQELRLQ